MTRALSKSSVAHAVAPAGRVAVFPGTFDPVTRGHLDIIARALLLCDRLIVAVADRHHKQTVFTASERVRMIEEALPAKLRGRVSVQPFSGLLVDLARQTGVRIIVRGLRVISDFEYEFQMALMNKRLCPQVETIFLMPAEKNIYLNATLVKEVVRAGGNVDPFVTANVSRALAERFDKKGR